MTIKKFEILGLVMFILFGLVFVPPALEEFEQQQKDAKGYLGQCGFDCIEVGACYNKCESLGGSFIEYNRGGWFKENSCWCWINNQSMRVY